MTQQLKTRVVAVPRVRNGTVRTNGHTPPARPRRWRRIRFRVNETTAVFGVAYVVYAAVGLEVTLRQHVVVFDALARLSHAYFVWHNAPPKLAAVGFVWPPLSTFVFLPLAGPKPIATSLAALPLTSAVFAAGTAAVLNRMLTIAAMPRRMRWALVAAFAVNPMIVFYAGNGMSESVYLFFLTAGTYYVVRWYLIRHPRPLLLASLSFTFGILSRYEVITWAVVAAPALLGALIRQRVSRNEVEGSLAAYLAPIAYGLGLWLFFNWLILNDALFWLKNQAPGGVAAAGAQSQATISAGGPSISLRHVVGEVVSLNARLFPLAIVVFVSLLCLFAARRNLLSLTLAMFVALNAAFTIFLIYASHAEAYSQLRYNMRAMPLALVAVGWIYMNMRSDAYRRAVWAATFAILVATLPLTWHAMRTWPQQYLDEAFTNAVASGADQEGKPSRGGYVVGFAPQREMAQYIKTHVRRRDAILTDDAQTFSVMLASGRPELFWDRIDKGDDKWLDVRENPWGRVRFALVSDSPDDLLHARYPRTATVSQPGFVQIYHVLGLRLFRVAEHEPGQRRLTS